MKARALVVAALALGTGACALFRSGAAAAEAAYGAELLLCVDEAGTLEESRACRAEVDARWGVDGGSR